MTEGTGRAAVRRVAVARGISLTGSGAAFAVLAYIVYRLTDELGGLALPDPAAHDGRAGSRAAVRELARGPVRSAAGARHLGPVPPRWGSSPWRSLATPGQLVALAAVTAVLESPVWAVAGASIPNLVEEEHLPWANGQVAIGRHLGSFIGPLLGTQLVVWLAGDGASADRLLAAGAFVFGINAVSFLFSAWLIGSTPGRFNDERSAEERARGDPGRVPLRDERPGASRDPHRLVRAPARRGSDPRGGAPLRARVREGCVRVRVDLRAVGRWGGPGRRVRGAVAHRRARAAHAPRLRAARWRDHVRDRMVARLDRRARR